MFLFSLINFVVDMEGVIDLYIDMEDNFLLSLFGFKGGIDSLVYF